jgi:hypothetical protein
MGHMNLACNSWLASKEIPCLLWNLEAYYCLHKLSPFLSQMNKLENPVMYQLMNKYDLHGTQRFITMLKDLPAI